MPYDLGRMLLFMKKVQCGCNVLFPWDKGEYRIKK